MYEWPRAHRSGPPHPTRLGGRPVLHGQCRSRRHPQQHCRRTATALCCRAGLACRGADRRRRGGGVDSGGNSGLGHPWEARGREAGPGPRADQRPGLWRRTGGERHGKAQQGGCLPGPALGGLGPEPRLRHGIGALAYLPVFPAPGAPRAPGPACGHLVGAAAEAEARRHPPRCGHFPLWHWMGPRWCLPWPNLGAPLGSALAGDHHGLAWHDCGDDGLGAPAEAVQ
mmetsp:Transcript_9739/g.30426  ORF Transcript_9739/g.30426 Transcript_9739/m.30426 type:complete len:227 (+) Transcript_9739:262-942(+)